MKSIQILASILLFSSSFLFINCTPSADFIPTKQEVISDGKWQVHNFISDVDLTSQYKNIQLLFKANGTIVIEGAETATGLWNISNENILQVYIKTHDADLLLLNGDWNIKSFNKNLFEFAKTNFQQTQLLITKI